MSGTATVSFPAYAYEAQGGDRIDGRTVNRVDDNGDEVTIVFTSGPGLTIDREHEVRIDRSRDRIEDPVSTDPA